MLTWHDLSPREKWGLWCTGAVPIHWPWWGKLGALACWLLLFGWLYLPLLVLCIPVYLWYACTGRWAVIRRLEKPHVRVYPTVHRVDPAP